MTEFQLQSDPNVENVDENFHEVVSYDYLNLQQARLILFSSSNSKIYSQCLKRFYYNYEKFFQWVKAEVWTTSHLYSDSSSVDIHGEHFRGQFTLLRLGKENKEKGGTPRIIFFKNKNIKNTVDDNGPLQRLPIYDQILQN